MQVLAAIGFGASIVVLMLFLIAAFPLVWERKAHACSALDSMLARQTNQWTPRAGAQGSALTMMPDAEVPAWFRCTLRYWRRWEPKPLTGEDLSRLARGIDGTQAAYLAGAGLLLGLLAFALRRRGRRTGMPDRDDTFSILGITPGTVKEQVSPPPVDLAKPIMGEAAWQAMRAHAKDAAYQRAVETLRLRYQLVGNQMLLPNTLREIMARSGSTFREAVLRVAEDDGIGRRQ